MNRLLQWTTKQVTGWRLFWFAVLIFALDITYSIGVGVTMTILHKEPPDTVAMSIPIGAWYALPLVLAIMALEESLFRLVPMSLAVSKWGRSQKVLAAAFVSSVLFGLWHGSYQFILIQGVGGFLYCLVFLKSGGFEKRYLRAGTVCFIMHAAFNAIVIGASIAAGNTTISVRLPFLS